jgi:3',5'-cyclic AMP phosphodiesterase CpdA
MPFVLHPISAAHTRRAFLGYAAGAATAANQVASLAAPQRPTAPIGEWLALLADTHISGNAEALHNGQNMSRNLTRTVQEILAEPTRPSAVLIDGDLALLKGEEADYVQLVECLEPLRHAGVPVHLTLGNHDDRVAFRRRFLNPGSPQSLMEEKHVSIVETQGQNLILLDSLDAPNVTPGVLGPQQLEWLKTWLDEHADRPCILFVHHNLVEAPEYPLTDTLALRGVIDPRKQVKAVVFGHTHRWQSTCMEGIHWLNLPAVAYTFADDQPLGWCRFLPTGEGATLQLRVIGGRTTHTGEQVELTWRKA